MIYKVTCPHGQTGIYLDCFIFNYIGVFFKELLFLLELKVNALLYLISILSYNQYFISGALRPHKISSYTIKGSHIILNKPKFLVTGSTIICTKDCIRLFSLDETNMKVLPFPKSFIFNNILP